MKRPYVNLNSENIVSELLGALHKSLDKFTSLKGVVGIILDGGLSRGYGISAMAKPASKRSATDRRGTLPTFWTVSLTSWCARFSSA